MKFLNLALLLLSCCAFVACSPQIPVSGDPIAARATQMENATRAAQVRATQNALEAEVAQLRTQLAQAGQVTTGEGPATRTPIPPTATPTASPTSTQTPIPNTPTPTITTRPCNMAMFIADVTIPDGTVLEPGKSFTKIWRLQNLGSCAWTADYALVFAGGDALNGPAGVVMPGDVLPGQLIDLSVDLVAPVQAGSYRGDWKLRDGAGVLFGIGRGGGAFYVDIRVAVSESSSPLDFASAYCQAVWTSSAGQLPCPTDNNDSRGFIRRLDKPTLENGFIADDPALLTSPQMITDGVIRGKFPALRVEHGYHFAAIIGCSYNSDACDVNFQLDYQIGGGPIQTLAAWHEYYDGQFNLVDVDLSSLAGEEVNFILTVFANGPSSQDRALWLAPHITKR